VFRHTERVADESAIDELFDAPLAEFTARRNALARDLKQRGDAESAEQVAALKKPTVPVWLVNRLARRRRRDVDLLLDAGHRLRAAHGETDPAKARPAFERAREAEREAMRRLAEAAEEILREEQGKASAAMIDRALATLRAASVTEEGRELLARGRLTEELATTGFDLAASLVPPGRKTRRSKKSAAQDAGRARERLREAKEREREASGRLREAERRAAGLRTELDAAEREVERLRAEVAAATKAVERARGR